MIFDSRITPIRRDLASAEYKAIVKRKKYVNAKLATVKSTFSPLYSNKGSKLSTQLLYGEECDVFETKNGLTISLFIIGFIFLFKIGEAFLGRMSIIFYDEMGFSKSDIAIYSKGLGWITTIVFTLLGGWFSIKSGVVRALFISGIAMAITNIMFSVMAWSEKSVLLFAAAVLLDDLAAAFATVAFVTFISLLVDRTYTATQYALLASLGTAGRTLMASSSGSLVDWLQGDWGVFFIITAVMVIPSLILLWFIRNKFSFN